jgi:hypothetical protein
VRTPRRRAALLLAFLAVASRPALAEGEPTPLSDAEIAARLAFLESRLEASRRHGQIWYWSWMAINGGSAVGLGIVAGLAGDRDDQVNNAVQAGVAAIGVADLLLRPLEARRGAAPIEQMADETYADRLRRLRAAEARLKANAERAEERTSWRMHAANVALNGAAGGLIAGLGRPRDGLLAFATGTAGGVVNLLTQPARPAQDWQAYEAAFGTPARRDSGWQIALAPLPQAGARLSALYRW